MATDEQDDVVLQETYYSVGGFVLDACELVQRLDTERISDVLYPLKSAAEMLRMAKTSKKSITQMKRATEVAQRGQDRVTSGIANIWKVMSDCIDRDILNDGTLRGGLNVNRRTKGISDSLIAKPGKHLIATHSGNDWMCA